MASVIGFFLRIRKSLNPPLAPPSAESTPIKFGILGAANIAPMALIVPAKSHPEAVVYAVAARDKARATAYAKKHGIEKVHDGYQELLDDPDIDVVYNPLPNSLHYEWTMKALAAGKHVLLEKPSASTADETRRMFELAEKKGLVLMEAYHYRFHPSIQRVKAIIESGELGAIKHISSTFAVPNGIIKPDDIRFDYDLGGGSLMDMGCYALDCIRYLSSSNPTSLLDATSDAHIPPSTPPSTSFKPNVDRGISASFALPNDATASLRSDLGMPPRFGLIPRMPQIRTIVTCEGGEIDFYNFVMPTLYHSITVTTKGGAGGGGADNSHNNDNGSRATKTRVEKVYVFADAKMEGKGEAWWSTYRLQLEAFVDRLKGRKPQTWVGKEDSIADMVWIERIYEKTGLGSRPASGYVLPN